MGSDAAENCVLTVFFGVDSSCYLVMCCIMLYNVVQCCISTVDYLVICWISTKLLSLLAKDN